MPQNWDKRRRETTPGDRCPECSGQVAGGRGGCQALFDEIEYAMQDDLRIASIHRLALDTYAMQHVESYCESAKSYAAHLLGLWWGVNHLDNPAPVAPVLGILNRSVKLIKPPVLEKRGSITLPDVMDYYHTSGEVDDLTTHVREWSKAVWKAYADQETFVQAWLKQ
ncbi:MAG TPA: DUF5946 family protein [Phototrophicaceae bacterium]|nr:DUF5946 family protein [Phototrophicaceae bacterium]